MESKKNYDTIDIFVYLWKKKKPILTVTILGAVISVVVSLLLPNYYKAETVLFPTTFLSPSTSVLNKTNTHKTDALLIGDEDDLEKIIQILNSDYITNRMIEKYNLISHYGFSPDEEHLRAKLLKSFHSAVSYSKTQYQGIEISVQDIDPKIASDMANDIANLVDSVIFEMQKHRANDAYKVALKAYEEEYKYMKNLEDSLKFYRKKGVLYYMYEVERYSQAYGNAIGANTLTANAKKFFEQKFDTLKTYGVDANSLLVYLEFVKENVANLHLNLTQAKQNLDNPISHKYVISKAQTPDKKAFPKRSIIVIFSTFGAFVFIITLLLFLDFFKELKKRIREN
ncbi:MAG: Wzz/FepE/Etk N-terminal domain-containing protein [Bacteroidota bacterium]|nr:Wzz/FepE/Etk N-terminal domain-containing protein [Bacteroidota bacterium]